MPDTLTYDSTVPYDTSRYTYDGELIRGGGTFHIPLYERKNLSALREESGRRPMSSRWLPSGH